MAIIILLICISVTIAVTFLGIFYWNMRSGQYDDVYTPSVRMLFDDKKSQDELKSSNKQSTNETDKNQESR
jgi:cbb3-type cytochrome oxidase maturation protein